MTSFQRLVLRPLGFALLLSAPTLRAQSSGDYVIPDFRFTSGESLPALRIHYVTRGAPRRDSKGVVRNAVLVLHGTGGTGQAFLSPNFAGVLFGPGQLLDTARYYVILPDGIGHGGSSKPSDGLHARFPHYTYDDMVRAQFLLLTEHLGVSHVRLILGTSMGCMHVWIWGYTHPAFADGLVPLACAPRQIAGRNRMMRTMIMDDIRDDPAWQGGDYTTPPAVGLRAALQVLFLMVSAPLVQQRQAPTRDSADSLIRRFVAQRLETTDANDLLYAFDASRDYDPSLHLAEITTPVLAINSADDALNPPELRVVEPLVARVPQAKFVLIPTGPETHGHGTHSWPAVWQSYLRAFLATLPER
jgi:homoserine O-acetyltransferase